MLQNLEAAAAAVVVVAAVVAVVVELVLALVLAVLGLVAAETAFADVAESALNYEHRQDIVQFGCSVTPAQVPRASG